MKLMPGSKANEAAGVFSIILYPVLAPIAMAVLAVTITVTALCAAFGHMTRR